MIDIARFMPPFSRLRRLRERHSPFRYRSYVERRHSAATFDKLAIEFTGHEKAAHGHAPPFQ